MEQSERFVQILLDDGLIRQEDWSIAQSIHKVQGGHIIEILLGLCPIREEDMYQAIGRQKNLRFWSEHELVNASLDPFLLQKFPSQIAQEYNFLPIEWKEGSRQPTLHLVVSDPLLENTLDSIRVYGGASNLLLGIATPSSITNAIQVHYKHRTPTSDTPTVSSLNEGEEFSIAQTSHSIAPPKLQMRECPACENVQPLDISHCNKCGSPMDLSQADPILGRTVGHFLLQSKLGEGGMGLVYKARNEQTHQETAVKVLRTHLTTNERVVKRFHREAQAQNHLRHDNIVYVHDFGFEEGVGFYIAMEFLRGKSMEEILVENPEMLTVVFVQSIVRQVCDAMGFAHSRGIYHRDLKPGNIFLVDQGIWDPSIEQRVKVLDFGVAKMVASEEDERLTRTGMTIGTPRYMAPEQAGDGKADHRSDIYSLGVILFEMLTGQSPFEGSSAYQIMLRHVYADPPSLLETRPDIPYPKSLEAFLQRTMAKEPQKRPASMDMFWQELAPCLQQLEAMLGPSISMHAQANGSFRRAQGIDNHTPETAEPPVIVGRMVQSQGSLDRVSTPPPPTAVRPIISPQAENSSWLQMEDLEFWEESVDQETQMGESAPSGPVGQAYPPPSRGVLSPIPPSRSSDLSPTVRTSTLSSGENAVPAAYRTRNPGISASQTPAPKTSLGSNLNIRASKDSKRTKSRQRGAVKARALKQKPSSSAKSKALLFSFVVLLLSTIAACAWYYTTQIQ